MLLQTDIPLASPVYLFDSLVIERRNPLLISLPISEKIEVGMPYVRKPRETV